MNRAFELKPMLVASAIGAVLILVLNRGRFPAAQAAVGGAIFGAVIQVGVRVAGVS